MCKRFPMIAAAGLLALASAASFAAPAQTREFKVDADVIHVTPIIDHARCPAGRICRGPAFSIKHIVDFEFEGRQYKQLLDNDPGKTVKAQAIYRVVQVRSPDRAFTATVFKPVSVLAVE